MRRFTQVNPAMRAARRAPLSDGGSVEPRTYRIEVEGELGPRYAAAFDTMRLEVGEGTTAIVGPVQDQAQLKGLLDAVATLGLALVSVTPAGRETAPR
jgi:hypothetical protein